MYLNEVMVYLNEIFIILLCERFIYIYYTLVVNMKLLYIRNNY